MDLKDVIANVEKSTTEAHRAFHAGHGNVAEDYLMDQMLMICSYFNGKITLPADVTSPNDNESQTDTVTEKPAEVPGAAVQPAAVEPAAAARAVPFAQQDEKPTQ